MNTFTPVYLLVGPTLTFKSSLVVHVKYMLENPLFFSKTTLVFYCLELITMAFTVAGMIS